jgi:hypothetical protein
VVNCSNGVVRYGAVIHSIGFCIVQLSTTLRGQGNANF